MKRLSILAVVLSLIAMACSGGGGSSSGSPSSPSKGPTTTTTTFNVQLMPGNENPPISNTEAATSGSATITVTANKDANGNVTSATANFQVNASGFPAGSTITMAHIHPGAAGVNGGIVVNTNVASGDLALSNGSGSVTKSNINVASDVAQAILKDPAGYYFNVHTVANPNGVIRGQLASGASAGGGSGTPTDPYYY